MSNPHFIPSLTLERAKEIIASHTVEQVSSELCSDPLLSVLVVTYQHQAFIRQCLDSILEQKTSFPFEIVIGDDGSTDGTFEILQEYQGRHPDKIRLLRSETNMGRYVNGPKLNALRNLFHSRGHYKTTIEGDDYWTCPDKLQRQVDILEADPSLSACFHDVEIVGDYQGELIFVDYRDKTRIYFEDQLTFDTPMSTLSIVWRDECLEYPEPWMFNTPFGDRLKMALLLSKGPMARIPEKLGAYRRHAGGITNSSLLSNFDATRRTLEMFRNKRRFFHPRADDYYDYMIRFTIRLLFKKARRPRLSPGRLVIAAFELLKQSPAQVLLTLREYRGMPSPFESQNIRRVRLS